MSTGLYVFSGTGNSLGVAKKIAEDLSDVSLHPIPYLMKKAGMVHPGEKKVGIITPVHYSGLPDIVARFIQKTDFSDVEYIFAIITSGGLGDAVFSQIQRLLKNKGDELNAGWHLKMVDNYLPYGGPPAPEKQHLILQRVESEYKKIAEQIEGREDIITPTSFMSTICHTLFYRRFINSLQDIDSRFRVDDTCNACQTCVRICPLENIRLVDNKPEWQHNCSFCLGCIHFCPKQAIQIEERHRKKTRYHHPDISVKDMEWLHLGTPL